MKISVLGLGQMGSAIAERLIDANHTVHVWNRSSGKADALVARGAVELRSFADAWDDTDICITMLADSAALADVVLAMPGGVAHDPRAGGRALIDMSTVSPLVSSTIASATAAAGIAYVRAPVSGNPGVVRAGNLTIIASGAEADLDAVAPVLRDIGPHLYRAGDGEAARIIKLGLNLMIAGTAELLAECMVLAETQGVDRKVLLEIVAASVVGSPFVKYKIGPLLADDYTSTFSSRLMRKDLDLALASGAGADVPLPVTALVRELLDEAVATDLGELDFMSLLVRLQREATSRVSSDG